MQYVYVKVKKEFGHPKQKLLIVKDLGLLKSLSSQFKGKFTARFIQIYGELELSELAQGSKKEKDEKFDVYRAMITGATSLTLPGYDLIPGELESVDMVADGPSGQVEAQVIGSAKHQTSALYGTGDIVFLNKGSQDGVGVGQVLDIFIDRTLRDEGANVQFSSVASGQVKVAKISESCATAVIVASVDSIQQGDQVRQHLALNGGAETALPPEGDQDAAPLPDGDSGAESQPPSAE